VNVTLRLVHGRATAEEVAAVVVALGAGRSIRRRADAADPRRVTDRPRLRTFRPAAAWSSGPRIWAR
jgi:hypothetical protein